jgi:Kdo2-lipid IVA lauroyltransferase/acyltransferase
MFKSLSYFIQSIFIIFFFISGRLIGLKLSRKLFSFLFLSIAPLFKSKKIIENNLNIFSKKISIQEKKSIIKNMWKNYGMTFIEYIFLNNFRKNSMHIKIDGENNLNKLIDKKKPVIFISGHFSNFELMSMEITKKGIKLATIYRPLNNYFLNPLMEYLRKKYVCKNQIKKGIKGVRDAINYINKDFSIALMIDQRVSEGLKINFFNKPALTTTLPAQLAIKYNLSIIPVFIERIENDNFRIEFQNEINSGNFKDKTELTKKLNQTLEEMIKKNPNQWIWTHNRWK